MIRFLVLPALLLPLTLEAQSVVVRDAGPGDGATIIRRVLAGPHVVRGGTGRLDLPRDSVIATSLLVLGRPTYLGGRVQGDIVVVGADLHLRPGVDVSGRAVAIGGSVAETTLGRVAGGVESRRDETFLVQGDSDRYALDYRSLRAKDGGGVVQLPGIYGVQIPSYDRVDGLSLPVAVLLGVGGGVVELEPSLTYRSRLGVVDPGLDLRLQPARALRFEGRVARDTRSNDRWIYSDLVNSATTLFVGTDTRNYFRADGGHGRLLLLLERHAYTVEPWIGGRYERVRSITAGGNVYSVFGKSDSLKIRRVNPLVERGNLGSALLGAEFRTITGLVTSRVRAEAEQSFTAPTGTSNFFQLTLDGVVRFPTFRTQSLHVRAHGVATSGNAVPKSRFAYLGGSGTLATLDLLEQGGTALVYLENRYMIPIDAVQLPLVGSPILSLRDAFGGAGIGAIPDLHHEVGVGVGLSVLHLDVNTAVTGRRRTKISIGVSLTR